MCGWKRKLFGSCSKVLRVQIKNSSRQEHHWLPPLKEGWLHVVYIYCMKGCLYWIHVFQFLHAFPVKTSKHAATQRICLYYKSGWYKMCSWTSSNRMFIFIPGKKCNLFSFKNTKENNNTKYKICHQLSQNFKKEDPISKKMIMHLFIKLK